MALAAARILMVPLMFHVFARLPEEIQRVRTRRLYSNPPIRERIVEVHVIPGPTSLGNAKDILQKRWSGYPVIDALGIGSFELQLTAGELGVQTRQTITPRLRFLREDRKRLYQVAQELFVANDLLPEPGWDDLAPMFREGFRTYCEVFQPKTIVRAVVRYLNRVLLPKDKSVGDLFSIFPTLPEERARVNAPFHMLVDMGSGVGGSSSLVLAFAGMEDGLPVYALDLIVDSGSNELESPAAVNEWSEQAHQRIHELFDSSITATARSLFEERISA